MVQDYLYCGKLMLFDTERSAKAPNEANYSSLITIIKNDSDYAESLLKTCIKNLSIPETSVFKTKREWETNMYTAFTITVARNFDWVASLVSMVPCIQSYYEIAKDLQKNSNSTDSLWYNNWVKPNNDSTYADAQTSESTDAKP
ncbi:hypothetical protein BC826DRAFT_997645 [Russula brevipes]|nr:hypothetical protein BC826DRAFT_997645 [Russula brevipes]